MKFFGKKERHRQVIFRKVFSGSEGAEVLQELCNFCGVFDSSFSLKNPNCCSTAFREGRRSVINEILNVLNVDIETLEKMYEKIEKSRLEEDDE